LIQGLAEYERLSDAVIGAQDQLLEHLFGTQPACRCRVAEVEGRIVGYALTFQTYSTFRTQPGVWLEDLFVLPDYRGMGFGKQLILDVIRDAASRGVGRVEWSVLSWNEPSIDFYKRIGAELLEDWRICRISL
jgi:GNAT superfamily N-acetyltransferase